MTTLMAGILPIDKIDAFALPLAVMTAMTGDKQDPRV
jgi:hypothetical protein